MPASVASSHAPGLFVTTTATTGGGTRTGSAGSAGAGFAAGAEDRRPGDGRVSGLHRAAHHTNRHFVSRVTSACNS